MLRHLSLLTAFSLLCTVGFSQNTNNGVIINSNVIIADPIYVPVTPVPTYPSALDRRMRDIQRQSEQQEFERESRVRAMSYKRSDFALSLTEMDDKQYEDGPTYVTIQTVNMRTHGGTESPVIRQLPKGTVVKIVDSGISGIPGMWWMIHVPGTRGVGYVHPKFVKPQL